MHPCRPQLLLIDVGGRRTLTRPAEAGGRKHRLERALREPRLRLRRVVSAGRDVVRSVRVEQRGEILDLAPTGTELPLAAAVGLDALLGAVVVRGEEPAHGAEARRLYV